MNNEIKLTEVLTKILERLERIERELAEIRDPILRAVLKQETRAQQAKRLGCCVNTLRNRERRERIRQMAERMAP